MEHFEAFQEACILHGVRLEHKEGATAALPSRQEYLWNICTAKKMLGHELALSVYIKQSLGWATPRRSAVRSIHQDL